MTDPLLHAWLAEIATQPADSWHKGARLVLADWLEERGDERAALRRVTVEEFNNGGIAFWYVRVKDGDFPFDPLRDVVNRHLTPASAWDEVRCDILRWFPEVTLSARCPWCPTNALPEGSLLMLSASRTRDHVVSRLFTAGDCLLCGGKEVWIAPASDWLPVSQLVIQPRGFFVWPGGFFSQVPPPLPPDTVGEHVAMLNQGACNVIVPCRNTGEVNTGALVALAFEKEGAVL